MEKIGLLATLEVCKGTRAFWSPSPERKGLINMKSLMPVIAIAMLSLANPSAWAASRTKRVIITYKPGTSQMSCDKTLAKLGGKSLAAVVGEDNGVRKFVATVAEIPSDSELDRRRSASAQVLGDWVPGVEDLAASDGVLAVEEDYRIKWIESAPVSFHNMPLPNGSLETLGLGKFQKISVAHVPQRDEIRWGVRKVMAPSVWDVTQGAGVKVAVIDTGIYWKHPDLEGQVAGGFNAITEDIDPESYLDDNEPGHGTHVAGIIAAKRNGKGVVGVAPQARLYAVKVLDGEGNGSLSDVIKGIIWAANNKIQVVNMSLGTPMPSPAMEEAVRYTKSRDVVIVAAAGNSCVSAGDPTACKEGSGAVLYPTAYPQTIAVSASTWDKDSQITGFSSRGPEVDFIAPGNDIVSTIKGDKYDSLGSLSGTSMSAPHVTGLATLAVSLGYRGLEGPDGVLNKLKTAARPLPKVASDHQGSGFLDARKLVD